MIRLLTYLGDKEAPGNIRVILPYILLNTYNNILANYDFTMSNSPVFYQGLSCLQVQRIATKDQLMILMIIKKIAAKVGFKIFYDIDDLITDVPVFNKTYAYYNKNKEYVEKILTSVDCIICSTAKLADKLKKYNKVKVIQNRLLEPIWRMHKHQSFFETRTKPKILWAGGHTHFSKDGEEEGDFDKKIMKYMLETSDRFEWIFCGHRPKELNDDRIKLVPWNPNYFEYPHGLRQIDADIGIALLQDNEFNKCKSNLKAMEYVALGIPGVYSDITPYQFMNCKVSNSDQFINSIEKLTSDESYYNKIKLRDRSALNNNLYWDKAYIKKYLDTYFKKK